MFARQDGTPIAPNTITQGFNEIVAELGLTGPQKAATAPDRMTQAPLILGEMEPP